MSLPGGYMGKMLWVDLSSGKITEEALSEKLCNDFVGGYGIGARILFDRMPARADPLGPENILGFVTGPATGTAALFGSRYTVVCKSPLTHTWGDANSGGYFGPALKFAGYDAVFCTGVSPKPVYLLIDNGKAELRDASALWGKDSNETEDLLQAQLGKDVELACIGPAGEKLSLISCIINNKGRAPARSGVGAVMGSKRLKAVVVRGNQQVPIANPAEAEALRRQQLQNMPGPAFDRFHNYGTCGGMATTLLNADAPTMNWSASGPIAFGERVKAISDDNVIKYQERRFACWRCPVACGGHMKEVSQPYHTPAGSHKPEYETLAAFGSMCLNDNVGSIIKANDICNRYGFDTISAGAVIAFAIECYENGVITRADTGGLELTWGNHAAIVQLMQQMADREGFGDVLADGVKVAAEKIGPGAEPYAIHIHGQEPGMHDPRFLPGWGTPYVIDATPGRHTQGGAHGVERGSGIKGMDIQPVNPLNPHGKGQAHRKVACFRHVLNSAGLCSFGMFAARLGADDVAAVINAVTGWNHTVEDYIRIGERIAAIRQAFNARDGINPAKFQLHGRLVGRPPLEDGPTKGVTVDIETQVREAFEALGWDLETGRPKRETLVALGMPDIAQALWPAIPAV